MIDTFRGSWPKALSIGAVAACLAMLTVSLPTLAQETCYGVVALNECEVGNCGPIIWEWANGSYENRCGSSELNRAMWDLNLKMVDTTDTYYDMTTRCMSIFDYKLPPGGTSTWIIKGSSVDEVMETPGYCEIEQRVISGSCRFNSAACADEPGVVYDGGGARSAPGDWASIHFSQERDGGFAWGMAWNGGDRASAGRAALAECRGAGGTRCAEAGAFRNSCGALAVGDDNGFGTGGGGTAAEAERAALVSCRSENANCRIEAAQCSGDAGDGGGARPAPPALAWTMTDGCDDGASVDLRFFQYPPGSPRSVGMWPRGGVSYRMPGLGVSKEYVLSCSAGYKVCYGAEASDGGWYGVDIDGTESCGDCCLDCPSSGRVKASTRLVC